MKKIVLIISISFLYFIPVVSGQEGHAIQKVEEVSLFTDRYLYIAGEDVCFSAFVASGDNDLQLSKVLYVEIITSKGRSISAGKYYIDESKSSGCLYIPDSLISGVYYLRGYTKYMRNVGPTVYEYLAIKVVNPHKSETLTGNTPLSSLDDRTTRREESISISLNKNVYYQGEDIQAIVKMSPLEKKSFHFSVIPAISADTYKYKFKVSDSLITEFRYYPETRGITVTGILENTENGAPLTGEIVNLSITGEGKDFIASKTDSNGRFFFSLPLLYGSRDIFLGTSSKLASSSRILIDNDFCALPVELPSILFELTDNERSLALEMAIRLQIKQSYTSDTAKSYIVNDTSTNGFYGTPVHALLLNNYVQLPNLEEYFNELPGYVKVRRSGGKKYFKVQGSQAEMEFYDPLVLVDWVAIDNPDNVLSIAPSKVEKIEMINEPYIKGNFLYGGIISIITKSGNFAGINLPQSGSFINFSFISAAKKPTFNVLREIPDYRNTIYSLVNPVLNQDNQLDIEFQAPLSPGRYKAVLKGADNHSSEYFLETEFEVLNQMP